MEDVVDVHEAKTTRSRLLERVERGDEIVVARAGRPVARLVPYQATSPALRLGVLAGRIIVAPDFDDEEAMADLFEATQE